MNRINYYFMWNLKWNNHKAVTWEDTISGAGVVSRRTRSEWAERCGATVETTRTDGACVRTSRFTHSTDTREARTEVHSVQTPKAKWTYLRVAAGTGRARYLNELPGRSGARRGRGQPAWLHRRPRPRASPLSWALISPGRAIQLGVARCISRGRRLPGPRTLAPAMPS